MKIISQLKRILNDKEKFHLNFFIILNSLIVSLEIFSFFLLYLLLNFLVNLEMQENFITINFINKINLFPNQITNLSSIFIFIFFLKTCLQFFINFFESKYIFNARAKVIKNLLNGYTKLNKVFFQSRSINSFIRNLTTECDAFGIVLHSYLLICSELILIILISTYLLFFNFKITLIAITALIIFSFIIFLANKNLLKNYGNIKVNLNQKKLKFFNNILNNISIRTMSNSFKSFKNNFDKINNLYSEISYKSLFLQNIIKPLFEIFLILILFLFLITFMKINSFVENKELFPQIGIFLIASYRLLPSFSKVLSNIQKINYNSKSIYVLANEIKFLDKNKIQTRKNKNFIFKNKIIFKNINFHYIKDYKKIDIFKNLNLNIKKGYKLGIFGESGTGKSTFLDLFTGALSPNTGNIICDNFEIKNILNSWQDIISIVPQNIYLINDSIKKNIAFNDSDKKIDKKNILKILKEVGLNQLIKNLPKGIETNLGDNGIVLSGGQKQRIALARALYKKSEVLILDEFTNALDPITEKNILNFVFKKFRKNTIIYVSHNKKNLSYCKQLFILKNKNFIKIK